MKWSKIFLDYTNNRLDSEVFKVGIRRLVQKSTNKAGISISR